MPDRQWDDFTEAAFRGCVERLKALDYRFVRYGESAVGRRVLWRHDVDLSMHRALRLAEIEAGLGVTATYFLNPRCAYYNLAEPKVLVLAQAIAAHGHALGLHFDTGSYTTRTWDSSSLEAAVFKEKGLLELLLDAPVDAISWHNPTFSNVLAFGDERIAGMANAYGARLRDTWTYASDSNGYWRFKPMMTVIEEGHERLHLLTHPEWWTPEPLSPSDRVDRCIGGRARATRADYDYGMRAGGRLNVGREP